MGRGGGSLGLGGILAEDYASWGGGRGDGGRMEGVLGVHVLPLSMVAPTMHVPEVG